MKGEHAEAGDVTTQHHTNSSIRLCPRPHETANIPPTIPRPFQTARERGVWGGGGKEGLRGTWRCLADSCAKRLSLNTEYSRIYSRIYSTYLPTARPYMFFCCKGFSCAAIWPCKKQRLASKKQASCVSWPFSLASRGSDAVKSKQS